MSANESAQRWRIARLWSEVFAKTTEIASITLQLSEAEVQAWSAARSCTFFNPNYADESQEIWGKTGKSLKHFRGLNQSNLPQSDSMGGLHPLCPQPEVWVGLDAPPLPTAHLPQVRRPPASPGVHVAPLPLNELQSITAKISL